MGYLCKQCRKEYKYRRKLSRHVSEHHSGREYWNCTFRPCDSTFIRRSYLAKHLTMCHELDPVASRECAINAKRGNHQDTAYYEEISEDDSIFDLIAEANGTAYGSDENHFIEEFNTDKFESAQGVVAGASNAGYSSFTDTNSDNGNNVCSNDIDNCDDSVKLSINANSDDENEEVDRDVNNDITLDNDEDIINTDSFGGSADDVFIGVESVDTTSDNIVYNEDEVSSVSSHSDHVGYIDDDDYDEVNDCINNDNHDYGDDSDCISIDLENNDDDYYGEELNQNDDNNNLDEELIYVSSDDEMVSTDLAIPDERMLTEILAVTFIKRTRIINSGAIDSDMKIETEYYRFEN